MQDTIVLLTKTCTAMTGRSGSYGPATYVHHDSSLLKHSSSSSDKQYTDFSLLSCTLEQAKGLGYKANFEALVESRSNYQQMIGSPFLQYVWLK